MDRAKNNRKSASLAEEEVEEEEVEEDEEKKSYGTWNVSQQKLPGQTKVILHHPTHNQS